MHKKTPYNWCASVGGQLKSYIGLGLHGDEMQPMYTVRDSTLWV